MFVVVRKLSMCAENTYSVVLLDTMFVILLFVS